MRQFKTPSDTRVDALGKTDIHIINIKVEMTKRTGFKIIFRGRVPADKYFEPYMFMGRYYQARIIIFSWKKFPDFPGLIIAFKIKYKKTRLFLKTSLGIILILNIG